MAEITTCCICEQDLNGSTSIVWIWPKISDEDRALIEDRISLKTNEQQCLRTIDGWIYSHAATPSSEEDTKPAFAVVLITKEYHPIKYHTLCQVLAEQYAADRDATGPLNILMACRVRNKFKQVWNPATMEPAETDTPSLKELWQSMEMETILAFVAVVLKRKVVVVASTPDQAASLARAVLHLDPTSINYDIYYPLLAEDAFAELPASNYVLATTNANIESQPELYDILVDATNRQVTVNPACEADFSLGKMHKTIATAAMEIAQGEGSDEDIQKLLQERVQSLLDNLSSMAENGKVAADAITSRKMAANSQRFLLNLARSRNMLSE
eukprot:TRINITY_DN5808_c0_g1_i2.p1 TRINITY_DN5808_c0_g1~~TRINITY_DN5808_c0_g1_i2.p1  ORF type:complete len:328 (+),score=88.48 TRINITY_DN5808_c0_g1_i2:1-984(+)